MTQKEREVTSKYGIMRLLQTINQERSSSHEYDNQEAKQKQEIVKQPKKRKKRNKPKIWSEFDNIETLVQKI